MFKIARKILRLTQQQSACKLDVSQAFIAKIDKQKICKLEYITALTAETDFTVEVLLRNTDTGSTTRLF